MLWKSIPVTGREYGVWEMRVAIIGCGQIAEAHLKELALMDGIKVVAVCDIYDSLAKDSANRFNIPSWYTSFSEMIEYEKPEVVHITVPPQVQYLIASEVIERVCHVYVEKPFCINERETREIIIKAEKYNVLACAGFSQVLTV